MLNYFKTKINKVKDYLYCKITNTDPIRLKINRDIEYIVDHSIVPYQSMDYHL